MFIQCVHEIIFWQVATSANIVRRIEGTYPRSPYKYLCRIIYESIHMTQY